VKGHIRGKQVRSTRGTCAIMLAPSKGVGLQFKYLQQALQQPGCKERRSCALHGCRLRRCTCRARAHGKSDHLAHHAAAANMLPAASTVVTASCKAQSRTAQSARRCRAPGSRGSALERRGAPCGGGAASGCMGSDCGAASAGAARSSAAARAASGAAVRRTASCRRASCADVLPDGACTPAGRAGAGQASNQPREREACCCTLSHTSVRSSCLPCIIYH
jgi:hypothetical protein